MALADRLKPFSRLTAGVVILIGFSVLLGWAFDLALLKSVFPALTAMNPTTALSFILAGFSLLLLQQPLSEKQGLTRYRAGQACALLVAAIGLARLSEYLFGWTIGIDTFLFTDKLGVNRMAPNTATNFFLLGTALFALDVRTRRGYRIAEVPALLALVISLVALVGYLYGVRSFYKLAYISMALNTALAFTLLSLGTLLARAESGLTGLITGDTVGGALARRLLPAVIALEVVLGWLRLEGQKRGLYSAAFGTTLFVVIVIAIIVVLILAMARVLNRTDAGRREAEARVMKLNETLQVHAAQLEEANKELEAFSYSVSHDLRSPLRHMDGFAEMLNKNARSVLDDKNLHYLDVILKSAKRMGQLIDDLLVFSRMGRSEMLHSSVNLDQLVRDVIQGLKPETEKRDIAWQIPPLPSVSGDPSMLQLVFTNLISNALKYTRTRAEAKIEIGCRREPAGEMVVYVRDNGVGFDMQYQNKLFGVFQRLHRADEFEGTGIGLANVRRIVQRHGGRTWAEGKPDGGATFYFSLPARKEENHEPVQAHPAG